jgi:Na+/H+ antiporter NhaA
MSLFISALAFEGTPSLASAKLTLLVGPVISAVGAVF